MSPTLPSALFLPSSLVNSTICCHQAAGVAQSHDGTMEKARRLWEGRGPLALSLARWKLGCRSVLARSRDSTSGFRAHSFSSSCAQPPSTTGQTCLSKPISILMRFLAPWGQLQPVLCHRRITCLSFRGFGSRSNFTAQVWGFGRCSASSSHSGSQSAVGAVGGIGVGEGLGLASKA